MLITKPDDGKSLIYHVINLLGITVHAYYDLGAARHSMEGDQRLAIWCRDTSAWLTDKPAPIREN